MPFVVTAPERFRVTNGHEQMAHYRDEASVVRAFCRRCGSCLYQDSGTTYYVCAGVLDELALRSGFQLHIADRPPWGQLCGDELRLSERRAL